MVLSFLLITGCDSGIGLELAKRASAAGYRVISAVYTVEGSKRLEGVVYESIQADLSQASGCETLVSRVKQILKLNLNEGSLAGIINNAGRVICGNVDWLDPEAYKAVHELNFHAPVRIIHGLLYHMQRSQGVIINLSSVCGMLSLPMNAAYVSSKHALESYTDCLRIEMRPWNIGVSIIEPATMRTELAMTFFDSWQDTYSKAPLLTRLKYGNDFISELKDTSAKALEGIAEDLEVAVKVIITALTCDKASRLARYPVGKMAHYFFFPVSLLPDTIKDALLYGISFPTGKFFANALPVSDASKMKKGYLGLGVNRVSHVTLNVTDISISRAFYTTVGFKVLVNYDIVSAGDEKTVYCLLQLPESRGPYLLLKTVNQNLNTDTTTGARTGFFGFGSSKKADDHIKNLASVAGGIGMPRIALGVLSVQNVQKIEGLTMLTDPVTDKDRFGSKASIGACRSPDGFMVEFVQPLGFMGYLLSFFSFLGLIKFPFFLHCNINVNDFDICKNFYETLGFKTKIDYGKVENKFYKAFEIEEPGVADAVCMMGLPGDSIFAIDLIQWSEEVSRASKGGKSSDEVNGLSSISIRVKDVRQFLIKLADSEEDSMVKEKITTTPVFFKVLPVIGAVELITMKNKDGQRIEVFHLADNAIE